MEKEHDDEPDSLILPALTAQNRKGSEKNKLQNGSGSAAYDSDSDSVALRTKKDVFRTLEALLTIVTDRDDEDVKDNGGRHELSNVDIAIKEIVDDARERDVQLEIDDEATDDVPTETESTSSERNDVVQTMFGCQKFCILVAKLMCGFIWTC